MAISAIQVEAYKKYVLVSLLVHGKLRTLPKYTSHVIDRYIRNITGLYNELATAYVRDKNPYQEIQKLLKLHGEDFQKDQNYGLVTLFFSILYFNEILVSPFELNNNNTVFTNENFIICNYYTDKREMFIRIPRVYLTL